MAGYTSSMSDQDKTRRRMMRGLQRKLEGSGLSPADAAAYFQSNPDAMRYPSQATDNALEFAKARAAARAGQGAASNTIAAREDPLGGNTVASRKFGDAALEPARATRPERPRLPRSGEAPTLTMAEGDYASTLQNSVAERVANRGRGYMTPAYGAAAGLSSVDDDESAVSLRRRQAALNGAR